MRWYMMKQCVARIHLMDELILLTTLQSLLVEEIAKNNNLNIRYIEESRKNFHSLTLGQEREREKEKERDLIFRIVEPNHISGERERERERTLKWI